MRNVQQRLIHAPLERVETILDTLASPDDVLWPSPAWPPLVLRDGLRAGSRGGHGPIRYSVAHVAPAAVRFEFDRRIGMHGYHEFVATSTSPDDTLVMHTIDGTVHGRMALLWPVAVRWLHEALLQDLLDNLERESTGRVDRPYRWSPWVRLIRRFTL